MSVSTGAPRTVINVLTTTFVPPPSCSVGFGGLGYCSDGPQCLVAYQAQSCADNGSLWDVTSCWPPASAGAPARTPPFDGWGFYSPGLYCPSGYASACTATAGGSSQWSVEYSMEPGETAVGCCPSGFGCGWNFGQTCTWVPTTSQSFEYATCSSGQAAQASAPTLLTLPAALTYNGTTGISSSITLFAPMIELRWHPTDRAQPVSTPGPSAPFATMTSTTSMTSTPTATSTSSAQAGGLSVGAEAAIGVVVPVVVLLIAAAALLFWRRRRNSKKNYDPVVGHNGSDVGNNESGQNEKGSLAYNPELDSVPMHEMHVQEQRHEILEDRPIELSADPRH